MPVSEFSAQLSNKEGFESSSETSSVLFDFDKRRQAHDSFDLQSRLQELEKDFNLFNLNYHQNKDFTSFNLNHHVNDNPNPNPNQLNPNPNQLNPNPNQLNPNPNQLNPNPNQLNPNPNQHNPNPNPEGPEPPAETSAISIPAETSAFSIPYRQESHPEEIWKLPPKMVVKAIRGSNSNSELNYQQGDYFFVVNDSDPLVWEVIQPQLKIRGLVQRCDFEDIKHGSGTLMPATKDSQPKLAVMSNGKLFRYSPPPTRHEDYKLSKQIISIDIGSVQLGAKLKWQFNIILKLYDGTFRVLLRTYEDFWTMHLQLLPNFPIEAGYHSTPRTIPFLPPMEKLDAEKVEKRRKYLCIYLERLVFTLSSDIVDSPLLDPFFLPRSTDISTKVPLLYDSSSALLDLIYDFQDHDNSVIVTFILGKQTWTWTCSNTITYLELKKDVEFQIRFQIEDLLFRDEAQQYIVIHDDHDVALLFLMEKVTLFCS